MDLHGTTTIKGTNSFKIPAEDFMISPVTGTNCKLMIKSIANGVINEKAAADITNAEYSKVHGAVPYTEFYISGLQDSDTYYVKW